MYIVMISTTKIDLCFFRIIFIWYLYYSKDPFTNMN